MNYLQTISEQLQDTTAAIVKFSGALATEPQSYSLLTQLKSLEKHKHELEAEFMAATNKAGIDVCAYRIFTNIAQPTISAISNVLSNFQSLITVVYDSIKTGPKERARITADVVQKTAFGLGYFYPGSVGVVLTIPNERLLSIESDLDETINVVFKMAKTAEPENIKLYSRQYGLASIRALYKWANDHVKSELGADIEWRRNRDIRSSLLVQSPEMKVLQETIDRTGDEFTEEVVIRGELIGFDMQPIKFHFRPEEGEDIRGKFEDAISRDHPREFPKKYTATIRKTTRIHYSREEDDIDYFLMRLE